ncbi:hypothetical protein Tco_1093034 [Tanacetum coccineum]|uniref:Uncharacterized protein n=1 Tax=Tanacetum coccineum TaxID=301880 RepID=A0ABQ5IBJ8_9ASTR
MEMANPPEIFDAKVSLRSKMQLLSKIKDEAPIVNEQSVKIDEQAGAVDDHDPTAPTDSNNLSEDVDLLFKEVIDVRLDLVERVDELRTKLVQTITSNVSLFHKPLWTYIIMRGKGDGSRASMYPSGIKPIGLGVSWDLVNGEAMLGNVIGIPAPAGPLGITPEDC